MAFADWVGSIVGEGVAGFFPGGAVAVGAAGALDGGVGVVVWLMVAAAADAAADLVAAGEGELPVGAAALAGGEPVSDDAVEGAAMTGHGGSPGWGGVRVTS